MLDVVSRLIRRFRPSPPQFVEDRRMIRELHRTAPVLRDARRRLVSGDPVTDTVVGARRPAGQRRLP